MHERQGQPITCDTDRNGSGAALKPCPVQAAVRYTVTMVFVLMAPAALYHDPTSEPAIAFLAVFSPNAERRVDFPPPRLPLTA